MFFACEKRKSRPKPGQAGVKSAKSDDRKRMSASESNKYIPFDDKADETNREA
jgi:hypothetical protein